ncbi:hypothetical protein NQZ68_009150 [Dissostichus eleginoides]|nr:hypothetical protein NQZ68_009150 [Dissostichus eleginoides]
MFQLLDLNPLRQLHVAYCWITIPWKTAQTHIGPFYGDRLEMSFSFKMIFCRTKRFRTQQFGEMGAHKSPTFILPGACFRITVVRRDAP